MCVCSVVSIPLQPHGLRPPGSSVRGILQAGIMECVASSFSRGSPQSRVTPTSLASPALAGRFFTNCTTWEVQRWNSLLYSAAQAHQWIAIHESFSKALPSRSLRQALPLYSCFHSHSQVWQWTVAHQGILSFVLDSPWKRRDCFQRHCIIPCSCLQFLIRVQPLVNFKALGKVNMDFP